jgi:hypothetical protein
MEEEFEDTKGVIRIRKSKKSREHNGLKKKYKRTSKSLCQIETVCFMQLVNYCWFQALRQMSIFPVIYCEVKGLGCNGV